MNRLASEKYNILLIILIFVIPLFAIDFGFYYISKINFRLAQKVQEKDAYNEAETLADEGKFNTEFAMHFVEFINEINNIAKLDDANDSFVFNHLKQSAKKLLGEYTNTKSIAKEMRGITTNIKRSNKNSWFIWDYIDVDNKGIYGVFLISDEIYNKKYNYIYL